MAADLRERVARAIAFENEGIDPENFWRTYLGSADAVLAELGLTQAEPVACTWPDCVKDGRCDVWCESAAKAGVPNPSAAPQPQALCSNCAADGACMKRQALCAFTGKQPQPQASAEEDLGGMTGAELAGGES